MSIRHVDDVMRVMQRPHDDGAQRLCFRFLQQPCVEVMIDTHDRVGEIVGDSVVHTHKTRKAPPVAAAFVTADTHADLNGVVKHTLEVSKVSFVPIDAAVEATGMESGGMSPIGLPDDWPLLVDQHVLSIPKLYLGSGIRPSNWWSTARSSLIFPVSDSSPVWASPGSKTPCGRGRVAQASRMLDENVSFLCLQ